MKPKHRWAESLRSGLARLRRVWQRDGCSRSVVIHLFAHVLLFRIVVVGLLFLGLPMIAAELGAALIVVLVAQAFENYLDVKFE